MTQLVASIVIPTFNRPERLRHCLDGIRQLEFDRTTFEVLVVDDGSTTSLEPVVRDFHDNLIVRLVRQGRAGPGAARNAGAELARGRFLVFIDDDCVPAPDWLTHLIDVLRNDAGCLAGGRVENALTSNPFSDASDRIGRFVYDYYRHNNTRERFFTSNNLAVATDRFHAVGGFTIAIPSATAEDKEFCDRWRARGWPMLHVPEAIVLHAHNLTFRGFLRQHFHYGRGILAFRVMRRSRTAGPLLPEPLKFYAKLITAPPPPGGHRNRPLAMLLVTIAQLATAAGAIHQLADRTGLRRARREVLPAETL